MRKITSLFALLLLFVGGAWAKTTTYAPGSRVSTIEAGQQYFIFNTAMNGTQARYGFYYAGSSSALYCKQILPSNFSTGDQKYYWTVEDGGNGLFYFKNVSTGTYINASQRKLGSATAWKVEEWTTSTASKAGVNSIAENGSTIPNANISSSDKVFTVTNPSASGNSVAWNGNDTGSGESSMPALWASAHPYAFYTVEEVTVVDVTYVLMDGGSEISRTTVTQQANSAVSVPSAMKAYMYEYTTSGTIGDDDCEIIVTRTLKAGFVSNVSEISNAKLYKFTPYDVSRGNLSAAAEDGALSTKGANIKFALYTYEGNMYLYSFDAAKFVDNQGTISGKNGTYFPLVDNPTSTIAVAAANYDYTFTLKMGGINCINASNGWSYGAVGNWNTLDGGNQFYIEAVEDMTTAQATALAGIMDSYFHPSYLLTYVVKDTDNNTLYTSAPVGTTLGAHITELPDEYKRSLFYTYNTVDVTIAGNSTTVEFTATPKSDAPFKFTADATSPVWNNLTLSSTPNYVTYTAAGAQNVTLPTTFVDDETTQWAFIGNPYVGFKIINRAAGTTLVLGSAESTGSANTGQSVYATLAAEGSQFNEIWYAQASTYISGKNGFFLRNAEGHALNKRNGTSNISYWTGGADVGSTFVATEVLEGAALYDALITQLEAINWGSGLGQYSLTGSLAVYAGNEAARIAQLKSEGYSAENLAGAQAMLENNALNMPQANTFLRIRSINGDKAYLKAAAAGTRETFTTTKDEQTIFLWDADGKLISYHSGLANNNVREAGTIGGGASQYSILPAVSGNIGQYSLTAVYNNGVNYLYSTGVDGSNADRNTLAAQFYQNNSFTLEEVTELPITLTNVKSYLGTDKEECYTTMYMPVAVTVTGAEVYTVSDGGNNTLDVDKLDDAVVPANTPVVLYAEAGSAGENVTATATVCTTTNTVPTSVLTGTVPAITYDTANDNVYVLSVANNKLGFYKFEGSVLKGFRAYYQTTGGSSTRGFVLNFGGTATGINAATLNANGNAYDLQGRRVQNAQKGVFIINGKKVVK